MSEISVVSARKVRLQQRAEMGVAGAQAALDLANQPGHFLSTVQIGITLIGILAGAFGSATLAEELGVLLSQAPLPWLVAYSEAISVGLVVVIITYLSLVIGELAPKQIGLNNPEGIAAAIAPTMRALARLAAPLVHLLSASTSFVLHILRVQSSTEPEVTEEEIKLLFEQGTEGGIFEPKEEEMVGQVLRLADRRVASLMTPRTEINWLDLDDPQETITTALASGRYSSYPVARGDLDQVVGVIQTKELLALCITGKPLDLEQVLSQPLFLPESMRILDTLDRFRESQTQIAFVMDEYGGIQGLVTITDILEAIAGDFPDAIDFTGPQITSRQDGSFLIDGLVAIDEFKQFFQLKQLPGEEQNQYHTVGGFVMTTLGRIPSVGDVFKWENLSFEVVDMDGLRVDKILVEPQPVSQA